MRKNIKRNETMSNSSTLYGFCKFKKILGTKQDRIYTSFTLVSTLVFFGSVLSLFLGGINSKYS